jgi:hypothetical protein
MQEYSDRVEIPVFVLSCCIFGRCRDGFAESRERRGADFPGRGRQIVGRYIATAVNEPCHDTYAQHGFIQDGDMWVYRSAGGIEDPDWLTVEVEAEAAA